MNKDHNAVCENISDHELILYEIYVTALQSLVDEGIWCRGLEEFSVIFGE